MYDNIIKPRIRKMYALFRRKMHTKKNMSNEKGQTVENCRRILYITLAIVPLLIAYFFFCVSMLLDALIFRNKNRKEEKDKHLITQDEC